ncbi:MAG TPA: hypothetical protein DIT01_01595 [Lentisphaeria bacterium]|nr:hypothetical protein [Lentisphaeria bacterium]
MRLCILYTFAALACAAPTVPAQPEHTSYIEWLRNAGTRLPGSPANLALAERVAADFAISGLEHGEINFTAPSFLPGKASLTPGDGPAIDIKPMHPSLVRPGNFPERSFTAPLVYLGTGTEADLVRLKGSPLKGSIGLMEYNSGDNWQRFLRYGVKGFVFIEPEHYYHSESIDKVYATEVAVPRYFIERNAGGSLKAAIRAANDALAVTIDSEPSRWKNTSLRNLWALIPGTDEVLSNDLVVVYAPMDTNCVVPELAVGARNAHNLALLMELFDELRNNPPKRSVLLAAVNGHSLHFLGERMLVWHLLMPEKTVEKTRELVVADIRLQELYDKTYSQLHLDGTDDDSDERLLIDLREAVDESTGRIVRLKTPVVTLGTQDKNQLSEQLVQVYKSELPEAEKNLQQEAIRTELEHHISVLTVFNKVGLTKKLSDLQPVEREILLRYVVQIRESNRRSAVLNRYDLDTGKANDSIRQAIAGKSVRLTLGLDLNWRNSKIGLTCDDFWGKSRWYIRFGRNLKELAESVNLPGPEDAEYVDGLSRSEGLPIGHYFTEASMSMRYFQGAGQIPSFNFVTPFTDAGLSFSPADNFEHTNDAHVTAGGNTVKKLVNLLLNDQQILAPSAFDHQDGVMPSSARYYTNRFDPFAASVTPTLPVSGSVVIHRQPGDPIQAGNVIGANFIITDERAVAMFYGLSSSGGTNDIGVRDHSKHKSLIDTGSETTLAAFHFDNDFIDIDYALDSGQAYSRLMVGAAEVLRMPMFQCIELPIYERNDPSLLSANTINTWDYLVLDAATNAEPNSYGFTGIRSGLSMRPSAYEPGPGALYVKRGSRYNILTSRKRLAINKAGLGYGSEHPLGADFFHAAALDMAALNQRRKDELKGVSNSLIDGLIADGAGHIKALQKAESARDHVGYIQSLYSALGAEVKAYAQSTNVRNDMLVAVVAYMALMLPFCFFLMKLLFKAVRVEVQGGIFLGLFVLTYLLFRNIHPAFSIAQAPEAIFVAFLMAVLGLGVIWILLSRFQGEMQLLFDARMAMLKTQHTGVGQQAMLIGVSNMKRRRIRTGLTAATIVLIAFTMLAFTSVSKKMSPTIIPQSASAPYSGLMFHWPGFPMDSGSAQVFRELFAGANVDIAERRWLCAPTTIGILYGGALPPVSYRLDVEGKDSPARVNSLLGLSQADDGLIRRIPMIAGSKYFSSDSANETILSAGVANALQLSPADIGNIHVNFRGNSLRVVGILRDEDFRAMRDINDRPLVPLRIVMRTKQVAADAAAQAESGGESAVSSADYNDVSKMILIPVNTCRRLGGHTFSISVRLPNDAPIWPYVKQILTTTSARFYIAGTEPFAIGDEGAHTQDVGTYYIGSGYRTSVGGLERLILPLLIACTIIMNTMLGSVHERKGEIAVYNAIGMNPTQIGLFFIAEALVFGIVGSVGGYLVGQVSSIGLKYTGWFPDVNFNFSSLSVVYVVAITIAVVVISTLYPAMRATREAVPSGTRKWAMPDRRDNLMEVTMPFIYQPAVMSGALRYMEEYFEHYTEASVGDLIAELQARTQDIDEQARDRYCLTYHLALAPYDLGVTQELRIIAAFDDVVGAYRITLEIERISGQDTNWTTVNKPFLERLRAYLMQWRNLTGEEQQAFITPEKKELEPATT